MSHILLAIFSLFFQLRFIYPTVVPTHAAIPPYFSPSYLPRPKLSKPFLPRGPFHRRKTAPRRCLAHPPLPDAKPLPSFHVSPAHPNHRFTAPSFPPLPILPPRTMAMPHHRCHQADEEATSPRSSAAGCCVLLTRSHHTASGATAGSTLPRPRGCSVRNPRWRRR
jgi:hypothetical protein